MYSEGSFFLAARILNAGASLFIMSLAAHSLDSAGFLTVAALSSFYAMSGILDFGLGWAGQSLAAGLPRPQQISVFARAAKFEALTAGCLMLPALLIGLSSSHSWVVPAGLVAGLAYMPLSLVERYRAVRQEMSAVAGFSIVATVLTCSAGVLISRSSMPLLLAVTPIGVNIVVGLVHAAIIWRSARTAARSGLMEIPILALARRSAGFLLMQASGAITLQSGVLMIAWLASADARGYSTSMRLIASGAALLASFSHALWPHVAATAPAHRPREVRRALTSLAALAGACAVAALIGLAGGWTWALHLLFAREAPSPIAIALVFAFLTAFVVTDGANQLSLGLGAVRQQVLVSGLNACANLVVVPLAILRFGPSGAIVAGGGIFLLTWGVPSLVRIVRFAGALPAPVDVGASPPS